MRYSDLYAPTLKEAPADAEVISHKLLLRAGMVRKITSGIYTYLPLGLRSVNKVAAIVREEMNRAGALEIFMPTVQPADLWRESGRWEHYGKELLRFKDRHGRDYCLGPTHEEIITDLIRGEVSSYKQLPLNLYQIQTKFRDEIRPRFGLMRGREFLMKDAYSFDKDDAGAEKSYKAMYEAYITIFSRLGLKFKAVEADSGSIGGDFSHEFMVLAHTGEDTIAVCENCAYASNLERAAVHTDTDKFCIEEGPAIKEEHTPAMHTVEDVAAFMGVKSKQVIKTLIFMADEEPVAALVRGDRELNPVKLKNYLGATQVVMAEKETVEACTQAPIGFAGPVGLQVKRIVADTELGLGTDYVAGANKGDTHIRHLCLKRDVKKLEYADLRSITEKDPCPLCQGTLTMPKGIEVGHVFKLGTKYSKALNATFLDEKGKAKPIIMGCYGIGVSRIVAACIEQNHDEAGIIFPPPLAPFEAVIICLDPASEDVLQKAEEIYNLLTAMGTDTLLDDRSERAGIKFKDADLIGCPLQITVGKKGLTQNIIEVKDRRTGEKQQLPLVDFTPVLTKWKKQVFQGWGLPK